MISSNISQVIKVSRLPSGLDVLVSLANWTVSYVIHFFDLSTYPTTLRTTNGIQRSVCCQSAL